MTKVLKVDPSKVSFEGARSVIPASATLENLKMAAETLKSNQPVAFPTETVYGLGASALSDAAVSSIYTAKNRPADNPLIIHVSSREQLETVLLKGAAEPKIPTIYDRLISKFWPGPLTILLPLPKDTTISNVATLGQTTFGVRMPQHPIARALIEISGLPLAAPSANASTKPSPTLASHVLEDMDGRIPIILDGGSSDVGVESTVVDGLVSPPQILRPGGVSIEEIREHGGPEWANVIIAKPNAKENEKVRTPGMKYRHYSPKATVAVIEPGAVAKLVGYVEAKIANGTQKIALLRSKSISKDILDGLNVDVIDLPLGTIGKEISHNLFNKFREADIAGVDLILVEGVTLEDEGLAIMNRVYKAASEVVRA